MIHFPISDLLDEHECYAFCFIVFILMGFVAHAGMACRWGKHRTCATARPWSMTAAGNAGRYLTCWPKSRFD